MNDTSGDPPRYPWEGSYPSGIDWHTQIETGTLPELLDRTEAEFGQRPGFDFLGRRYSWRDLAQLSRRVAEGLVGLGLKPGDRVALVLPNSPYYVAAFFGVLRAGGIVVNVNPLYAERELIRLFEDSGARFAFTLDLVDLAAKLVKLAQDTALERVILCPLGAALPFPKNILYPFLNAKKIFKPGRLDGLALPFDRLIGNRSAPPAMPKVSPDDVAVFQYTGGTTGIPKAAMLTHANLVANSHQARLWFTTAVPGEERMLGVLPFFHVFALVVVMLLSVRCGAEILAMPRYDRDQMMKLIDRRRPTLFPAVPTIYAAIADHPNRDRYDIRSIRLCISGGAPLPQDIKERFEAATGCTLVEGYGLTEASPVVAANPLVGVQKSGTIGLPIPGTVVELINLEDGVTPVARGERGELCVRGPQVMKGYWGRADETADSLRDGRLHTGDVAVFDEDGYLTVVDRIKDLIISAGFNVYPRLVEEAIYLHPAVCEAVVAGVTDANRGQVVKAWVKVHPGASLTQGELKLFLRDKLAPVEIPKRIEFRDELPRTPIGKLSRKALLEEEVVKASTKVEGSD